MGAEKVYAADISEDSQKAVEINSRLNSCSKIEFRLTDLQMELRKSVIFMYLIF